MSSKIDVRRIFLDHIVTMRNERTGSTSIPDIFVFFFVPVCFGIGSLYNDFYLPENSSGVIITALSIFSGLLMNVLLLVYGIFKSIDVVKEKEDESEKNTRKYEKKFLKEIFTNISFAILVAVSTVILVVGIQTFDKNSVMLSGVVVAFGINFILTLLMVLKRIYNLLSHKFIQSAVNFTDQASEA